MRALFTVSKLLVLLGLGACAQSSKPGSASQDTANATLTQSNTGTTTGFGTTTTAPAIWVSVDGLLEVTYGEINTSTSTLNLEYFDAELNDLCAEIRTIESATTGQAPETETSIFSWWYLELAAPTCTSDFAEQLWLGLGEWDSLMSPAADADGLTGENLYGLYVQENPLSPLVVFGVAGSAAQFAGNETPITEGTLPDNTYQLRSLYLLPTSP